MFEGGKDSSHFLWGVCDNSLVESSPFGCAVQAVVAPLGTQGDRTEGRIPWEGTHEQVAQVGGLALYQAVFEPRARFLFRPDK